MTGTQGRDAAARVVNVLSLCSGYGGLDLAVEAVFGAVTVAHAEYEPAPSKVLAARWPGVPNLGDITQVTDWPAADIITAGYPCQPFSHAGQRKGTDDARHLWPYVAEAIRRVRPQYVVLENVAGHRSMGFDAVLGDLAADGYDAQWTSIRAADVGAPHGRGADLRSCCRRPTRHRRHRTRAATAVRIRQGWAIRWPCYRRRAWPTRWAGT